MITSRKKSHYGSSEWVDFVRGVVSEADRQAMQAHLDSGCSDCRTAADLFAQVAQRASGESEYEPPAYALHYARSIYRLQQPEEVRLLPKMTARLVFDSFRGPLPAGVRSQRQMIRQVLYRAGNYYLDFRLEHERDSRELALVGQITNQQRPELGIADVPVLLMSGKTLIAQARSNQFGEFQLKYRPAKSLRLHAMVPTQNDGIEVRLGGISPVEGE